MENTISPAIFTFLCDDDVQITTKCKVNLQTKEVFDIEKVPSYYFDCLEREYVTIKGERYPVSQNKEYGTEYWYAEMEDTKMENGYFEADMEKRILNQWEEIASYMNDEKREQVHNELVPCGELEFLQRYLELDEDFVTLLKTEFHIEL